MLVGAGLALKGGPSDGVARLSAKGDALEVACTAVVKGNLVTQAQATVSSMTVLSTTTPAGQESVRRLEMGQHYMDYFPGIQASLPMGSDWKPIQLVVNAAGGGAWLPKPLTATWNGLSVNTRVCNTDLAFECTGDSTLRGNVIVSNTLGLNGCTAPAYALDVIGEIRATGDIIMFSDARLKANLQAIQSPLLKLGALTGYTFERKDDSATARRHAGLVAQEVERVLPEAVYGGEQLAVAYGPIAALCVEGIKELTQKIERLEAQIRALQDPTTS